MKLNSEILAKTFELKEKMISSDTYKELKEKEQKMINDQEAFSLLNLYQSVQDKYNEAKRFEKYGGNVENAQKELMDVKKKVYENEYVKEYNLAYRKMQKELNDIEKILFKDIIKERKVINIE